MRHSRLSRLPRLLLLAILIGACATNPVTGKRELILMSPEREAEIGRAAAEQVTEEMGLVDTPALAAYVSAIGARVASGSPRTDVEYRFHVVDMPEPNAFALPGGYVYVSRGLLALANSEDELANVIAHEVAHVAARHSAQRQTRATGVGLLAALGTIAAAVAGGAEAARTVGELGQLAGAGLIASYSRDQEREADSVGQALAARQGWDPGAMSAFLRSLERDAALKSGGTRSPSFLDSHPATPERVASASARARELTRASLPSIASGRADFLARIAGTLVGQNPAGGLLDGQRFTHPDLDFYLSFPAGWTPANDRSFVGARNEDGSAIIKLEVQGAGSDPEVAAGKFVSEAGLEVVEQGSRGIGALPGYRVLGVARTDQGNLAADLVWTAHRGRIFRLSGVTSMDRYSDNAQAFARTAQSFRPLRPGERAAVRETRLRVAAARAGETVAQLSGRTDNTWSAQETAVTNALEPDARLQAGQLLKIAVAQPYPGSPGD